MTGLVEFRACNVINYTTNDDWQKLSCTRPVNHEGPHRDIDAAYLSDGSAVRIVYEWPYPEWEVTG